MKVFPEELKKQADLLREMQKLWEKETLKLEEKFQNMDGGRMKKLREKMSGEPEEALECLVAFGEFLGVCADRMDYTAGQYCFCQENELDILRAIQ